MSIGSPGGMKQAIGIIRDDVRRISGEAHIDEHTGAQVHDLCLLLDRLCHVVEWQQDRIQKLSVEVLG